MLTGLLIYFSNINKKEYNKLELFSIFMSGVLFSEGLILTIITYLDK